MGKIFIDSDVVINSVAEHRDDVMPKSLYDDVNVTGAKKSMQFNGPGEHLYNYIDKPDFDMNTLVTEVNMILGKPKKLYHWPYWMGYLGGLFFDILAFILHKKLQISSIRVKKFCSNTMFEATNIKKTDFKAPVSLIEGLKRTIKYEFIDKVDDQVFYTE